MVRASGEPATWYRVISGVLGAPGFARFLARAGRLGRWWQENLRTPNPPIYLRLRILLILLIEH
jgi:hypothetical protein